MAFDVDQFFQSIDIILTQRLADLSYDKTIIATIVDDSDKDRGHYVVSDGTIKFDAYTNDINYRIDDQVRITVLNGDWSQKKFIEGKYTDGDGVSAITYTPPLYTVMQDNQSTFEKISDYILYANYFKNETDILKPIWTKKITTNSDYYTLQANGIYNTITLQGDFQTNLSNISSGNYGLLLELFIQPEVNSDKRIRKYMTFDSSEMIGNPYSFVIDSHQAKQITIASEGIVMEMILYIYQISNFDVSPEGVFTRSENAFMLKDGTRLPGADANGNPIIDNAINFKNITIGFGSDLTKVENNSLHLYTTSSNTYHYNEGVGDESNDKYMGFIWYNKAEDNKYIGFSDGLKDNDYDEIEYNKVSYADSRLMAQKTQGNISTDELSLELAANYAESEIYYQKAYEALTTDLSSVFQSLGRQIIGTEIYDAVSKLVSSYTDDSGEPQKAILVQRQDNAREAVQKLATMYAEVLTYGYNKQHNTGSAEWNTEWDTADYYNDFVAELYLAFNQVEAVMNDMNIITASGAKLSGYRGIFNAYNPKVTKVIKSIKDIMNLIIFTNKTDNNEDVISLKNYKNKTSFVEYASADLSAYANKYAIYWYRYNEGYIPDMDSDEYKFAHFLGANWERVAVDGDIKPIQNFGLPTIEDTNNPGYYPASPEDSKILYRRMSPTAAEERYQVVLFNNHQMVKSNIITFINTEADQIPNEFKVDANDKLIIEHGTYSQDHYQSYSSAFDLVNIADETRSRQLKVTYDGVLVGDEALAGAGIYWYIPTNSTMLTYDKKYLTEKLGFIEESEDKTPRSRNGYTYFYKEISYTTETIDATDVDGNIIYKADGTPAQDTKIILSEADRIFAYKIKPYYEASAQNNTIQVEAYVNGQNGEQKVVTGELSLTFSTFGTNGTKYTFVLTPATTQIAILSDSNPDDDIIDGSLNLTLSLRNADNELIAMTTKPIANFGLDGEVESYEIDAYALSVGWHATPPTQSSGAITPLQIENSEQWNVNVSLSNNSDKYMGIVSSKVQYNTDGKTSVDTRIIELSNLYPVPFASSENYYISGPTSIIYDNQGIVSRHNEEPFKLYSRYVDDGTRDDNGNIIFKENVLVDKQTWSLVYYDNQGNKLDEDGDDYETILAYMPKLNSDNTLMPASMYYQYDDNTKFYIPVAICKDEYENILWTQPIVIAQNQYASSTLNDWNGQFEINEENGTILSTMIGAGRKTVNNTFEGVLMGDIEAGANFDSDNASGLGLYGFNDGAQSFYFGVDGKAFLGKAGRGRIYFDGESGTIASASYEQIRRDERYTASAGMKIDLDDGFIHMLGVKKDGEEYSPDNPEDSTAQAEVLISTGYLDDRAEAYFKIRSKEQIDPDHYLMYVDTDNYYLQTDDYTSWNFTKTDGSGELDFSGKGLKLDLKTGKLDAYNFQLSSKNVYIDSTDDSNGFFIIKDNAGVNLLFAGKDNYYLKSSDFQSQNSSNMGSGIKLNLMSSSGNPTGIEAYNFNLRAGTVGGDSQKDHAIILSDNGEPYLRINTTVNNAPKALISFGIDEQYLQSSDYDGSTNGILLDLKNKKLEAYSGFKLTAKDSSQPNDKFIIISANASDSYPLQIGKNFMVDWAGQLTATGGTFTGTIHATGGTFAGDITASGSITGGDIIGANIYTPSKDAPKFSVTKAGRMTATSANIGGWEVTESSIESTNGSFVLDPDMGISSDYLYTDETGKTTAIDLEVQKSLTALKECQVSIYGNMGINIDPDKTYDLKLNGNMFIKGGSKLYFGNSNAYIYALSGDGGSLQFYGGEVYIQTDEVGIGKSGSSAVGIGGNPYTTAGSVRLHGKIYFDAPDGIYVSDSGWLSLPKYIKKYSKGLLGITIDDDSDTGGIVAEASKVSNALKLTVNSNELITYDGSAERTLDFGSLAFANDIKKKFNMTLTGTVAASNHNYYVLDSATGGSYTPVGKAVSGTNLGTARTYCIRGDKLSVYTFTSASDIYYRGTNYGKSVNGIKCENPKYEYGSDVTCYTAGSSYTLYEAGTAKTYATYKKAGDLAVKVTASQDVTLIPTTPDETTTSISISATNGTATISG